ncbi:septal ring lytic transglycosylase RlpA family protein [Salinarimonas soli]|uniref:Endolytic peptidoglycan transglycosylase RlpA n=1 Tax=Salinarimonas soli TaxID=1638099 RepID=A0A5B2VH24_9HYPH|nr:septal ring lytic transglycosylase RlpA family protein [Salinarimonas soli]KAA2238194.1 septal ring lytic transglycosylase RlpA family protein [Salinarimonas soli]
MKAIVRLTCLVPALMLGACVQQGAGLDVGATGSLGATDKAGVLAGGTMMQRGMASYYRHGRRTANGEAFNPGGMTAAHRTLPFGTRVKVVHEDTGRAVVVRINDRGPFSHGRVIDLAHGPAQSLGLTRSGVGRVALYRLD